MGDTNIFVVGKNLHELAEIMNSELINISKCLKVRNLKLNIGKTHYIVFSNINKTRHNVSIKIDNQEIDQTTCTQFLGEIIDSNFNLNS